MSSYNLIDYILNSFHFHVSVNLVLLAQEVFVCMVQTTVRLDVLRYTCFRILIHNIYIIWAFWCNGHSGGWVGVANIETMGCAVEVADHFLDFLGLWTEV